MTGDVSRSAVATTATSAAASFCVECGRPRTFGSRFCAGCGTAFTGGSATPSRIGAAAANRDATQSSTGLAANQYGWALAVAPLAFLATDAALALGGYVDIAWVVVLVVALGVNTVCGYLDELALSENGHRAPSRFLAMFLVPAYLVVRAIRVPGTSLVPVVWLVCALVYFGGSAFAEGKAPVHISGGDVESAGDERLREFDMDGTVICDGEIKKAVGETFTCSVIGSELTNVMEVRVDDTSGGFVFSFK